MSAAHGDDPLENARVIRALVSVALAFLCIGATSFKLGFMPAFGMWSVWLLGVSAGHATARVTQKKGSGE